MLGSRILLSKDGAREVVLKSTSPVEKQLRCTHMRTDFLFNELFFFWLVPTLFAIFFKDIGKWVGLFASSFGTEFGWFT